MAEKECLRCIHKEVCKTAESCDGYVSGCKHFREDTKKGRMDMKEKLMYLISDVVELYKSEYEELADHLIANGVTVREWISVKERTPTEADGTVWVCLADVFPYNEKEPYIDAKHDRRITEAFYSQFSKRWYKDGAVFPDGFVTHWMEKAQPPKGE